MTGTDARPQATQAGSAIMRTLDTCNSVLDNTQNVDKQIVRMTNFEIVYLGASLRL